MLVVGWIINWVTVFFFWNSSELHEPIDFAYGCNFRMWVMFADWIYDLNNVIALWCAKSGWSVCGWWRFLFNLFIYDIKHLQIPDNPLHVELKSERALIFCNPGLGFRVIRCLQALASCVIIQLLWQHKMVISNQFLNVWHVGKWQLKQ